MIYPGHDHLVFPGWKTFFLHLIDDYLKSWDTAQVKAWNFDSSYQQDWSNEHLTHLTNPFRLHVEDEQAIYN